MENFSVSDEFNREEEIERSIKTALLNKAQELQNIATQKTLQEEITEFKKKSETLRKNLVEKVEPEFQKLLTKYDIEAYRWAQYTPYFMDGDECIFSVNSYSMAVLHNNEFLDEDELYDEEDESTKENLEPIINELQRFVDSIPSDIMKTMFGDHVEVTITSKGIDIEYYEHD